MPTCEMGYDVGIMGDVGMYTNLHHKPSFRCKKQLRFLHTIKKSPVFTVLGGYLISSYP